MVCLPREDLQAIFDIAVEGEGMLSGWWGQEEVESARKIAVLLGVDPMLATPDNFAKSYPHDYQQFRNEHTGSTLPQCKWCRLAEDVYPHEEEEK